jgi:hypothetical protein
MQSLGQRYLQRQWPWYLLQLQTSLSVLYHSMITAIAGAHIIDDFSDFPETMHDIPNLERQSDICGTRHLRNRHL